MLVIGGVSGCCPDCESGLSTDVLRGGEGFDDRGQLTGHDGVKIVPGAVEAVVGEAILGEVVGANFFGS